MKKELNRGTLFDMGKRRLHFFGQSPATKKEAARETSSNVAAGTEDPAGLGRRATPTSVTDTTDLPPQVGAFAVAPTGTIQLDPDDQVVPLQRNNNMDNAIHGTGAEDEGLYLVEARLVQPTIQEEMDLVHATEVPAEQPHHQGSSSVLFRCIPEKLGSKIFCLCAVLLVTAVAMTGILCSSGVCGPTSSNSGDSPNALDSSGLSVTFSEPASSPKQQEPLSGISASPTVPPAMYFNAFGAVEAPRRGLIFQVPDYSLAALDTPDSPQNLAYEWLASHPALASYPDWQKQQLFALVALYYTFIDHHIFEDNKFLENWLSYEIDECGWGIKETLGGGDSIECNREGKVERLHIVGDAPYSEKPDNPVRASVPEIELLTSLRDIMLGSLGWETDIANILSSLRAPQSPLNSIDLQNNQLFGELLTSDIGPMTNLIFLNLEINRIRGPLPSELGLLTKLSFLSVYDNLHTGQVPTEVGLMTDLTIFGISCCFSGSIPSEVGLMTSLDGWGIWETDLEGPIPEEVCSLPSLNSRDGGVLWVNCTNLDCISTCTACTCQAGFY